MAKCPDCTDGERILNPDWPSGTEAYSEKCPTCGGSSHSPDEESRPSEDALPDFYRQRTHVNGCAAPFVGRECDCPPERLYVALDDLLAMLNDAGTFQSEHPADYLTRRLAALL